MKWSEVECPKRRYGSLNENEKSVRGYFLHYLGIDLENLPEELFVEYLYYDTLGKSFSNPYEAKIMISEVVGTKHEIYGGKDLMYAFLQEHRVLMHIINGNVTRGKYFKMLKKHIFDSPIASIRLIKGKDGKYYVGDNGNHRITFYKLMQIADQINYKKNKHLYWLYAQVVDEL